ncbi:hypothetical protein K6119_00430 [Paracrocinitomix mangrovi]|uniref:hypothetical protein n=1 Tax=Paracrocinitomix mangrovi TaxID=2862509 RepID=UPI001C8DA3E8|nr:hypothetical protein [Paracrocinitomix mangrovi]UKN01980.1 hypothetical protein K6119_00430 [Paracrocinitomix mangrovi]
MIILGWVLFIAGTLSALLAAFVAFAKATVDDNVTKLEMWFGFYLIKYPKWLIILASGILLLFLGRGILVQEGVATF